MKSAVGNVDTYLKERQQKGDNKYFLPKRVTTAIHTCYRPELDVSPVLGAQDSTYYQSLVGILQWMIEIGCVDICLEVSMMSSHMAMPREGHLIQLLHIFGYLNCHHNTELVFDPTPPDVNEDAFAVRDWSTSEFSHVQGKASYYH